MFTVNDEQFGWEEIVSSAQIWGEWQPFLEETRQSLACLRLAVKTGQLPAGVEMRQAATAFRYAHNLVSAEDARSWLARWEMTVDEWMNCLRGQLLRERWADKLDQIVAANPVSDTEVDQVVRRHAICADTLGLWAQKLAGHAAVVAKSGLLAVGGRSAGDVVAQIEAEFAAQSEQAVTPQRLAAKIADHRLDWIRFDCRYVWFPLERIAREAAFCVSEDGLTLDEVAYDARSIVQQWNFYLDEVEAAARPYFLAAHQGDWLGPVKMLEGFPLFSIVAKQMPAADDPQIRERAERAIIRSVIEQAMSEQVKWTAL